MKKQALILMFLIVSIGYVFSQTVYDNSQDGKLFFKIKDDVRVLMPAKNNNIDISEVNFLSGIIDAYQITSVEKAFDLKGGSKKLNRIYLMQFAGHAQVDNIIRDLENINNVVEYAERVPLPKPFYTPDDPFYTSTEWGYNWNWYLDVINAEDAWDISTGDANINVAVVDNAIWADHPDLTNKVVAQYNAVTDTEGNSSPPTSVPQDDSETAYEWSHGTHCAGLVGAETDNNLGIASIGYNVSLMTARGAEDNGDLTHTAYGVQWAANNGADVISMSYGSSSYSSSMEQFFQDIKDAGIVLVAAAGNDGVSTDHYPAAYSSVIAVGASDADDQLSSFSQYGSWVDIAAPGGYSPSGSEPNQISLTSTTYCEAYAAGTVPMFSGENYDIMQGTSMACPVAAGLVGLMVSLNPALTPDEVLSCLQTTADPLTGGNSISPDGGRINALEAMECVLSTLNVPPVADFSAVPTTLTVGNTVTFTESCTGTVDSMHWNFPGGSPSSATGSGPHDVQYDTVGQYDVSLTAYNAYGSDTETKNAYIDVVEVSTECDTLSNIHDDDTITYYTTAEGYVSGHNEYDFEEFAEYFSASPAYNMTGVVIGVAKADALSADPKITLKVWDDNSGEPGNELYTEDVDLASLTAGSYNSLDLQNEVAVPAEFYVGYQIYYNSPQDTFAVYMAKDRGDSSPYNPTAYTTYNSAWSNLDDLFSGSGGLNTAYVIYPVFCPPAPTADFTADQYEGCDSLLVSFTDQSSSNTNSWYWDFDDGDTSSLQNPDHNFETPGTYHVTLIASNNGGSDSHTDTIFVYASPSCDLGPDINVCADETPVTLDPGSDPDYDYQWTGGFTTPSLLVDTSGTYQVTVTNNMCSATDEINVSVLPLSEITQQPENNDLCMSEDHTLTIAAEGINLTYQWQKDGTDIPGATSDSYTINNADLADEGDYNCIVSGTCDTVSSDTVSLVIGTTTQITSQPSGTTVCEGNNHTFSITATGSNLSYQWKKDGVDVGTNDPSLTINNITLADAGDYTCVASGDCGTETSDPASLVVTPLTQITDQPDDAVACQGENHSFTLTASGDNLTYQWQKDGADIPGATSDAYTISNADLAEEGDYNCIVSGTCDTVSSDTVSLVIGTTTQITSHPSGTTVCEGNNHTFSITATGSNLSYQWKKDGVNVGTDNPSLTINSATPSDAGNYYCVVTGACGTETSDPASLVVTPLTQITDQPDDAVACQGENHSFTLTASGDNLTYQWQKDGTDISGATSDSYTINNADLADEGDYHCIVSGTCGNVNSDVVNLTIGSATQITSQPAGNALCEGDNHSFTLTATGSNLSYQWKKDGVNVGTDNPSLTINSATPSDAGNYYCVVTGACGTETSVTVSLTVNPVTQITDQPDDAVACQGENHSFTLTASGDNLTYQWQKDGTDISGATSDSYTINNADLADEGDYHCIVSGTCGNVNSDVVNLAIGSATQITSQPTGNALCEGDNHSFTLTATGSNLSYQWKKDGVDVGTDNPSLTINSATPSDAGNYYCVVTGACGTETSVTVSLTVSPVTQITDQPDDEIICQEENHSFSVTATGDNLTYQWQKDGVDIPGATSDAYTINNVSFTDEGNYQCIVSGTCGTITSDEAELIYGNAEITSHPNDTIVCEGSNHTFHITATGNYLTYQWQKDGVNIGTNQPSLTITNVSPSDVGIYHCYVSTPICGEITSDGAGLSVSTMPYINIDSTGPLCTQDATVTLSASPSGGSWSGNGVNGNNFDPAAAGTGYHTIVYQATNGVCTRSDSTQILVGSQPDVDTTIVHASSSVASDGSVTAHASGGLTPYSYAWSNGDNDNIMENVPAGSYSLTVTDDAGCKTVLSPIVIDFPDVLPRGKYAEIHVYPNPADKEIFIHTGNMNQGKLILINVLGQCLLQKEFYSKELQLDVSDIDGGMYFIRVYNENSEFVRKVEIN